MPGIDITVSQNGDDPTVTLAYLPEAKTRVLHQNRAVLPVREPHHLVAALVQFEGGRKALEELAQITFELGRRHEFMRLSGAKRKTK